MSKRASRFGLMVQFYCSVYRIKIDESASKGILRDLIIKSQFG